MKDRTVMIGAVAVAALSLTSGLVFGGAAGAFGAGGPVVKLPLWSRRFPWSPSPGSNRPRSTARLQSPRLSSRRRRPGESPTRRLLLVISRLW